MDRSLWFNTVLDAKASPYVINSKEEENAVYMRLMRLV